MPILNVECMHLDKMEGYSTSNFCTSYQMTCMENTSFFNGVTLLPTLARLLDIRITLDLPIIYPIAIGLRTYRRARLRTLMMAIVIFPLTQNVSVGLVDAFLTDPYFSPFRNLISIKTLEFFNCAEVSIQQVGTSSPTISPKPTTSPTTDSPTVSLIPTTSPIVGPQPRGTCKVEYQDCTYDWEGCCGGLQCTQISPAGYGHCLKPDTCDGSAPTPPTTPTGPTAPTGGTHCCYGDRNSGYQQCMNDRPECNASESECSSCGGLFLSSPLVRNGCCTWTGGDCSNTDPDGNSGCQYLQADCEGDCGGTWQLFQTAVGL